jgi:hypothetical protein
MRSSLNPPAEKSSEETRDMKRGTRSTESDRDPVGIGFRSKLVVSAILLGGLLAMAVPAQAINCLTPEIEKYYPKDRPIPEQMVPTHQVGNPMRPPANPQVGDSWMWYLWYFAGGPPRTEQHMCSVRGLGTNVYVIVDDRIWGSMVQQSDVDAVVANWDNHSQGQWPTEGIFQLNTENFGPAPDMLDHNPRIYVVLYDWDVTGADGVWVSNDEYPDGTGNPSNECECLYVDASTSAPGGAGGAYLTAVTAHEFQHMIHWYADANESTWVNEGCAELAMWLWGHPDTISGFNTNPDNNLMSFSSYADYVKTYLFTLYFYEHFGGQAAIRALVAQPLNSNFGYEATLTALGYSTTFPDLVRDWVTANFLDDPTLDGGKYNYAGEDLPTFASITKSSYPVPTTNATVNHWAADYVKFTNGQPQRLNFDGGDTAVWGPRVVRFLAGTPLSVEDMPLDGVDAGYLDLNGFGTTFDTALLIVSNLSTTGLTSYAYSTSQVPTAVGDAPFLVNGLNLEGLRANPFSVDTALRLTLDRGTDIRASVLDALGRNIRLLETGPMDSGAHVIRWDGRNEDGARVPGGLYFVHVTTNDGREASSRVILVR